MRGFMERGIQVFIAVCDLLGISKDLVLPLSNADAQRQVLRNLADLLAANSKAQAVHTAAAASLTREAFERVTELRSAYIQPIVRAGERILPEDHDLQIVINVSELTSYEATMVAALELADRVEPSKAQFVAAGFKEDFTDVLRTKVAELRTVLSQRAEHAGLRSRATAAIEADYARAKTVLRILDVMVSSAWKSKPELLAQWKTVSNLPSANDGRKGKVVPSPAPAPVPVPVVAPTPVEGGTTSIDTHVA